MNAEEFRGWVRKETLKGNQIVIVKDNEPASAGIDVYLLLVGKVLTEEDRRVGRYRVGYISQYFVPFDL